MLNNISELRLVTGRYAGVGYIPSAGSPLLGMASFTDKLLASWFEKVDYIGAFASNNDNWLAGWTNFDPQNTDY